MSGGKLAATIFVAPLFGVMLSGVVLNEAVFLLWVGLALVASGIYPANRPNARGRLVQTLSQQ